MLKDVIAMTAAIVILSAGTAAGFWEVVLFGQKITEAPIGASKPAVKERTAAKPDGGPVIVATPAGDTVVPPAQDAPRADAVRAEERR